MRNIFFIVLGLSIWFPWPKTAMAQSNPEIVAAVIVLEAGGEGEEGMQAVMNVIVNRANNSPNYFALQVLKPMQFSCVTKYRYMRDGMKAMIIKAKMSSSWETACTIVQMAFNKQLEDITHGATHYHVYKGVMRVTPSWTHPSLGGKNEKAIVTTKINHHAFLRNVD